MGTKITERPLHLNQQDLFFLILAIISFLGSVMTQP